MRHTTPPLFDNRGSYYSPNAFDFEDLSRLFLHGTRGVNADTLVGVGMSGALVAPMLAHAFGYHYAIVRKEAEMERKHNHDSRTALRGSVGERWMFVDDFVDSGATLRRAHEVLAEHAPESEFMGAFSYHPAAYDKRWRSAESLEHKLRKRHPESWAF